MKPPVYLDHFATTPVDPRVFAAMAPYFTGLFGNPGSQNHSFGWEAAEAVENARREVAELVGASPKEIIFTSGATESNNLAVKGASGEAGCHLITVATEHKSVLEPCLKLAGNGHEVTVLPVDGSGLLDLGRLEAAITGKTLLASIMFANNEIGVIQPVAEIGRLLRAKGVLFHCDATQAVGKVSVDVDRDHIDLLSLSAHKFHGPKGVGALYLRRGGRLTPLFDGGGQERSLRSGTLNVPGIVGLGKASLLAGREMADEAVRLAVLRDRLQERILRSLDGVVVNGSQEHRLAHNLNLSFTGIDGDALLNGLAGIALSRGSTCGAGPLKPSHVLTALGISEALAQATLRFGLGRMNTMDEIDYVAERVVQVVNRLRRPSF